MIKILSILILFSLSAFSSGCSKSGGNGEYDKVISFSKGEKITFPDFVLEFQGIREEKSTFPNGNSFTFRYYDFDLTKGDKKQRVSWTSGTGLIDPRPFEFDGKNFELEMKRSEKLNKKLDEDELVMVKK